MNRAFAERLKDLKDIRGQMSGERLVAENTLNFFKKNKMSAQKTAVFLKNNSGK